MSKTKFVKPTKPEYHVGNIGVVGDYLGEHSNLKKAKKEAERVLTIRKNRDSFDVYRLVGIVKKVT